MNLLKKQQRILQFLPIISTPIIALLTIIEILKKKKRAFYWGILTAILLGSVVVIYIVNEIIMSGLFPILNFLASWGLSVLTNMLLIAFQERLDKNETISSAPRNCSKTSKKFLIVVVVLALVGIVFVAFKISFAMKMHRNISIEDTNGDIIELNTITESDISSDMHHPCEYTMINCGKGNKGGSSGVTESQLAKLDYDSVSMYADEFSGILILQATKITTDCLRFDIESEVKKGNFAIAIVIDGAIYDYGQADSCDTIIVENAQDKIALLVIAGETADFQIKVQRTVQ